MKSKIRYILLSFFISSLFSSPNVQNPWHALAKNDLKAIHIILNKQHPATVDISETSLEFRKWLDQGYRLSLDKLEKVNSYESYAYLLSYFCAGFKDPHLFVDMKLQKKKILWPGLILKYERGAFITDFVSNNRKSFTNLPPYGAHLIACDGKNPKDFVLNNLFPYTGLSEKNYASWVQLTPQLLFDQGNPWSKKIKQCSFSIDNQKITLPLTWVEIDSGQAQSLMNKVHYTPRGGNHIRSFKDNSIWVFLPNLYPYKEEENAAMKMLLDTLKVSRDKSLIVFDLRGNQDSQASPWPMRLANGLFGEPYIHFLKHIRNQNVIEEHRLSDEKITSIQSQSQSILELFGKDSLEYRPYLNTMEKLNQALEKKKRFLPLDKRSWSYSKNITINSHVDNPVSATVVIVTDAYAGQTAMRFLDIFLSIPKVVHIGQETPGTTLYASPEAFSLPSGIAQIICPTSIFRNWERNNNEPYTPQVIFPGSIKNTQELEHWILEDLIKREKETKDENKEKN